MQTEDNIATRTLTRNAKGFVLIELLTAVAIIAILIGLLLPAIQRKREAAAAEEAMAKVREAAAVANYYRNRRGEYPRSLAQLVQFFTANPAAGISIDPRLASGRTNGYLYEIVDADQDHCTIEAEPEFPGITGSKTVQTMCTSAGGEVLGSDWLTPGSDEAREEMFSGIRAKAAETVMKLVQQGFFFDIPAELRVRSFVDRATMSPEWIFGETVMDADGDSNITIDELRNYDDPQMDAALKGPLAEFMDYTDDACMWGSLTDEARSNIGVGSAEIELARGEQAPLFSYDGLAVLIRMGVACDGVGTCDMTTGLCAKLEAAEAAEASGNLQKRDKVITSFKKQVRTGVGGSVTDGTSNTIFFFLDILTDASSSLP